MTIARKLRILVLAGGPSAERDVSLQSGAAVAYALTEVGHEVTIADIGPSDLSALEGDYDVVFPVLHGTFGEDGQLQKHLESRNVPFVGSDSKTSAVTIDKALTKDAIANLDVLLAKHHIHDGDAGSDLPSADLPVVIKPTDQGSSVATFIVHEQEEFAPSLKAVTDRFGSAMVEQFIGGEELTVGIVGDTPLPPITIRPKRGFYDYDAKYLAEDTEYLFDAGHSDALLAQAQSLSLRVFRHLGCRHLGRVDWIVDADGQLWFLEVNTIPGFTSHSLVPKAAQQAGIAFGQLVDRLVQMAMEDNA